MSVPAITGRAAAWAVLLARVSDEAAIEFAKLLLAFEENEANGEGALYFHAGQGQPHDWGVTSKVTIRRPSGLGVRQWSPDTGGNVRVSSVRQPALREPRPSLSRHGGGQRGRP
jgi:hypothetical protein